MNFHYVTPDEEHVYDYNKALENREKLLRFMTFTKEYLPGDIDLLITEFSSE